MSADVYFPILFSCGGIKHRDVAIRIGQPYVGCILRYSGIALTFGTSHQIGKSLAIHEIVKEYIGTILHKCGAMCALPELSILSFALIVRNEIGFWRGDGLNKVFHFFRIWL